MIFISQNELEQRDGTLSVGDDLAANLIGCMCRKFLRPENGGTLVSFIYL
jgi:hypothetical protein